MGGTKEIWGALPPNAPVATGLLVQLLLLLMIHPSVSEVDRDEEVGTAVEAGVADIAEGRAKPASGMMLGFLAI